MESKITLLPENDHGNSNSRDTDTECGNNKQINVGEITSRDAENSSTLHQERSNFTKAIYNSESNFRIPETGIRWKLRQSLNAHYFQVIIVSFVIVDCMVVIAELLMDLRLISTTEQDIQTGIWNMGTKFPQKPASENSYLIPDILHSINIAILAMFILEMVIKMFAFGLVFLKLGWEIFDFIVIITTFAMDVVLQHSHSATNGLGLLIILRLWRVARILNGMVRSVRIQADRHMKCEKRRREALEEELCAVRSICQAQKNIILQLETLIQSHNIPVPQSIQY